MKRSKRLRANAASTRAWVDRSRANAVRRVREAADALPGPPPKRGSWKRANPRHRGRPGGRERAPGANGWTQRVFALYGHRCVVCGGEATQGHHAVPRQRIVTDTRKSRDERAVLEYDARNGVPVCWGCHEAHENASSRIPRRLLPVGVVAWAREHGYGHVLKPPVYT